MPKMNILAYASEYSPTHFGKTIKRHLSRAGREVVYRALLLHYTAQAPDTPLWCKTTIYGALGYFISLFDFLPDLTPILGYTDDLAILAAALASLGSHVTPQIRQQAEAQASRLFGSDKGATNG